MNYKNYYGKYFGHMEKFNHFRRELSEVPQEKFLTLAREIAHNKEDAVNFFSQCLGLTAEEVKTAVLQEAAERLAKSFACMNEINRIMQESPEISETPFS